MHLDEIRALIQQETGKEQAYLRFAQDQAEKDRAYFEQLFKRTVWFLGVLLTASAVAIAFFGIRTLSDMSRVSNDATAAISHARESADEEIEKVRSDAAGIARTEAGRKVDEAFEASNVKIIVEEAARKHVGAEINKEVNQEVGRRMLVFDQNLSILSELADIGVRVRVGLRSGLDDLGAKAKSGGSEFERSHAAELLSSIRADYDAVYSSQFQNFYGGDPSQVPNGFVPLKDPKKPIPALVAMIRSKQTGVGPLALAFIALRKATGQQFTLFDFDAVERWCKDQPTACDQ